MKTLKKFGVALVVLVGIGLIFASCSEEVYYESPVNPIEQVPVNPIGPQPEHPIP